MRRIQICRPTRSTKIGVINEPIPIPTPAIPSAIANAESPASGLFDAW